METFQSQNQKHKPKRHKKRLNQDQLRLLETSFNHEKKLEPERKAQLARDLALPPRQVAIWYQNKRARWKSQSLELDYRALQLRLDSVCADKKRLEREVGILRVELQKAHEMLLLMNLTAAPNSSVSMSPNEGGSSSLPGDMNCHWEKAQILQVEELYACLMSTDDQTEKLSVSHDIFSQSRSNC